MSFVTAEFIHTKKAITTSKPASDGLSVLEQFIGHLFEMSIRPSSESVDYQIKGAKLAEALWNQVGKPPDTPEH